MAADPVDIVADAESDLHSLFAHLPVWVQALVAVGLGIVFLGWFAHRIAQGWQRRQRALKPTKGPDFAGPAVPGTARVRQWKAAVGSGFLSYDIALRVAAPGRGAYEVTVRQRVPIWLPYNRRVFRPGVIVAVQIDSTNPRNVWVDFSEGFFEDPPRTGDEPVGEISGSPARNRLPTSVDNEATGLRRFVGSDGRERKRDKEILICVTSDGLTVDTRPGDVFSLSDAMLGVWSPEFHGGGSLGTALQLRCENPARPWSRSYGDGHSFVLGGKDYCVGSATPLHAEITRRVDAWLAASDFDDLLTVIGRRGGLDIRRRAPGEPIRCHLIPLDPGAERPPHWALDLGTDQIWVVDPYTNARIASACCAQVIAIPTTYVQATNDLEPGLTSPVLVLDVPGVAPLTIRPVTVRQAGRFGGHLHTRFSWRGKLPRAKYPRSVKMPDGPAYGVTDADWLTLVEKFGWAPHLQDQDEQR